MKRLCAFAGLLLSVCGARSAIAADTLAIVQQRAETRGYRVREVWLDPILQQRWAVLQSVAHPELPFLAELTDFGAGAHAVEGARNAEASFFKPRIFIATRLAVRSGDRVVLWSADQNVRIQMGAVAEGNAGVGERIQLRVTGAGVNGDTGWRLSGIVRGPGSVEMER